LISAIQSKTQGSKTDNEFEKTLKKSPKQIHINAQQQLAIALNFLFLYLNTKNKHL